MDPWMGTRIHSGNKITVHDYSTDAFNISTQSLQNGNHGAICSMLISFSSVIWIPLLAPYRKVLQLQRLIRIPAWPGSQGIRGQARLDCTKLPSFGANNLVHIHAAGSLVFTQIVQAVHSIPETIKRATEFPTVAVSYPNH